MSNILATVLRPAPRPRLADPYRDLGVIDARAPRFNQGVVGVGALAAVATGAWPLLGLLAAQLAAGLIFGRRACLPCVAYFELVQPRFGEGPLEDARPVRFANLIGALMLGAATLAAALGAVRLGAALGLTVAALALLASVTGLCVGCELYRVTARLRGVRGRALDRVDLADLGLAEDEAAGAVLEFTHPLCSECHALARRLQARAERVVRIDVARRPDLAAKYGVAVVPLAFRLGPGGAVGARVHG